MKRLFCLFFIFTLTTLFADNLKDAISLYNKKEYKQAYAKVQTYLKKSPSNIRANRLLGDCAYMLGLYDDAMAAYDRVLILDPNNMYSKIQEAKIFAISGYKNMSKLELDAILASGKLTDKQREEALKIRNTIDPKKVTKKEKKIVNGSISIGLMYDTNTNGDIGDKSFNLPSYNLNYKGSKEEKDFAIFENLYLSADLNMDETLGLLTTLNIYNRNYFDMSKNDLSYLFLNVAPYYESGGFKILLPLVLNKAFLGHNSYVNMYGGGIDIKKYIQNGVFEAGYRYFKNDYYKKNDGRDSNSHNLYAGVQYLFLNDMLAYTYLKYATNREKKDLRTDVNYNSFGIDIGLNKEIVTNFVLRSKFGFKNYDYKDFNKVFLNKRSDKVYSYGLGLTYNFLKSSSLDFDIDYIDRNSNQLISQYDRFISMLSYMYRFWKDISGF